MKKIFILIITLVIGYYIALAEEVVVSMFSGNVLVWKNNQWVQVEKGTGLNEKDEIKTLEKSKVVLLFSNGSTITLAENTQIKIESLLSEKLSVYLKNGKAHTKVKPLQKAQVFELKTPVSVASVRGTEFIISYVNNNSEIIVIEGNVLFSDMSGNSVEVGELETCSILEGTGLTGKSNVNREQVDGILNEFKGAETESEGSEQKEEKTQKPQEEQQTQQETTEEKEKSNELAELRNELKEFVSEVKLERYYVTETIQQVKEADFQTGRTLLDVHGNLTRVEQTVSRNKGNSIEFINITKRDSYKYNRDFLKDYKELFASNKPRVDIFKLGMEFSNTLPENISEWPSYIAEKGDNFYPTRFYSELSNTKDKIYSEITFEKSGDKVKEKDKIFQISNGKETYNIDVDYDEKIKGKLPNGESKEDDDGKLWFWAQGPIPVKEDISGDNIVNNKDILWLQTEGYIINNSGNILTSSYFTSNSNKDPFTILKEVAFESIIFVRKDNGGQPGEAFFNSNIDLVATPDIALALVKKIAPSLTKLDLNTEKK
jgi:hypothetical protein